MTKHGMRGVLCWLVLELAACGYPPLGASSGVTADADGQADTAPAGAGLPLHVLASSIPASVADLRIPNGGNIVTIDTDALTLGGQFSTAFVRQGDYVILFARNIDLDGETTIRGAAPLIIAASGTVTISARVNANAVATSPGPGSTAVGAGVAGQSVRPASTRNSSGGGGGSYGAVGGAGGSGAQAGAGGARGTLYGGAPTDPLTGGSPGGNGGFASDGLGVAGGGGGALQISAAVAIHVFAPIAAGGGGGRGGQLGDGGGGGGGAGGEILLEAPQIMIGAPIVAMGGGGGAGGAQSTTGTPGQDGGDSTDTGPGAGGMQGTPTTAAGGAGAGMVDGQLSAAQAGGGSTTGGGGGGGAGRIWLRYRAATPPLGQANAVPPAGLDSTLP